MNNATTTREEALAKRLCADMAKLIGDAGTVLDAQAYEPAKGGGWAVVVDTEYAALKIFYKYRYSNVKLDKVPSGYAVCVR